jgi:hypothetical protein
MNPSTSTPWPLSICVQMAVLMIFEKCGLAFSDIGSLQKMGLGLHHASNPGAGR